MELVHEAPGFLEQRLVAGRGNEIVAKGEIDGVVFIEILASRDLVHLVEIIVELGEHLIRDRPTALFRFAANSKGTET